MTREEFEYLQTDEARNLIEKYIDTDPSYVALRTRNSAVATQIKNLQKCRMKLPSYYAARCIVPTVSYEQSSSEAVAFSRKDIGSSAVDLTCGLGVDAFAMAHRFDCITAVEIDQLRADIARWNFTKLGLSNVEVVCSSAEEFLKNNVDKFDLVFVDPSRRSSSGRSVYAVDECQPDVLTLMPELKSIARRGVVVKLSPLFDIEQSFRLFGQNSICEIITVNNECKELVVKIGCTPKHEVSLVIINTNSTSGSEFLFSKDDIGDKYSEPQIEPQYLLVPDIAFYKSRTVSALMNSRAYYYYCGGYVLTEKKPDEFPGKVFEIAEIIPYRPKILRKRFRRAVLHIRNFPYSIDQIAIPQGGNDHLFFTIYQGNPMVIIVK